MLMVPSALNSMLEGDWVQPSQEENLQRDFVGWGEKMTKIMDVSYDRL